MGVLQFNLRPSFKLLVEMSCEQWTEAAKLLADARDELKSLRDSKVDEITDIRLEGVQLNIEKSKFILAGITRALQKEKEVTPHGLTLDRLSPEEEKKWWIEAQPELRARYSELLTVETEEEFPPLYLA